MGLLITYLLTALLISFVCSILEAVLLSTPQSFVVMKKEKGEKWATVFYKMKKDIDKPLSAVLIWNTVAHTVGAAGVGAQAIIVFGNEYFGLVSAILTILILIITEIIPKTLGALYWGSLVSILTKVLSAMIFISYPLILISVFITRIISKRKSLQTTSREEIAVMANIGKNEGIFADKENLIIQNIIKLKNVKVSEIMTPRVVMVVADENMSMKEFMKNRSLLRFSRIPVYKENSENISGYVLRQNVLEKLAEDKDDIKLKEIKRNIAIVHESIPLLNVWEILLEKREHISLVVDEYGGVAGIVTMEDVVESVLGFEIIDEKDTISDMQEYARQRWKMRQVKYDILENLKEKK